jgi:hypothetical protein
VIVATVVVAAETAVVTVAATAAHKATATDFYPSQAPTQFS